MRLASHKLALRTTLVKARKHEALKKSGNLG